MISFGYTKLTFDISMAFIRYDCRLCICARARFYHAFLRKWFDSIVLLKQSAFRNRGLFNADIVTYRRITSYKELIKHLVKVCTRDCVVIVWRIESKKCVDNLKYETRLKQMLCK